MAPAAEDDDDEVAVSDETVVIVVAASSRLVRLTLEPLQNDTRFTFDAAHFVINAAPYSCTRSGLLTSYGPLLDVHFVVQVVLEADAELLLLLLLVQRRRFFGGTLRLAVAFVGLAGAQDAADQARTAQVAGAAV